MLYGRFFFLMMQVNTNACKSEGFGIWDLGGSLAPAAAVGSWAGDPPSPNISFLFRKIRGGEQEEDSLAYLPGGRDPAVEPFL